MSDKFYYQILITTNDSSDLVFWVRDEKIDCSNDIELKLYVKRNLPILSRYKKVKNVIVHEVNKTYFDEMNEWYRKNSKPKDFIVVNE